LSFDKGGTEILEIIGVHEANMDVQKAIPLERMNMRTVH